MTTNDTVMEDSHDDLVWQVTHEFLSSHSTLDSKLYSTISDALEGRGYEQFKLGSEASVYLKWQPEGSKAFLISQREDKPVRYTQLSPHEETQFIEDCRTALDRHEQDDKSNYFSPKLALLEGSVLGFISSWMSAFDPLQILCGTVGTGIIAGGVAYLYGHRDGSRINLDEKYSIRRYGASALNQI